jgi:hypothetical protein
VELARGRLDDFERRAWRLHFSVPVAVVCPERGQLSLLVALAGYREYRLSAMGSVIGCLSVQCWWLDRSDTRTLRRLAMFKGLKKWAVIAALFGGTMFHIGSCGFGGQTGLILAILQEDIFG